MSSAGTDSPPTHSPGADALAVVVTAGVTPYLRRTLRALARQTVAPRAVLVVDVASRDNGLGDGTPVEEAVAAVRLDELTRVRIVRVPDAVGFGDAVTRGMARDAELAQAGARKRGPSAGAEHAQDPEGREGRGDRQWLWLLHDDAAPAPGCLEALLEAVAEARSAALVGPKQVDWDHPDRLLEVGLRTTASGRRANDVVAGEIDQGQHDDRSDVLGVGTAGALIDRAVWDELGGTSPDFPVFNDGLELSRAVRLAGHRVVVVPRAIIRHRRAAYLGLRPAQGKGARDDREVDGLPSSVRVYATDADPDRSFRARRISQLTAWATFSSRPIGLLLIWFLILGLARAGWRLLTKSPGLAGDELGAAAAVFRRGGGVKRGRERLAAHATVRRSVLTRLYVDPAEIRAVRRDRGRQERERAAREEAPSELELRELAAMARRRRLVGAVVLTVSLIAAGVGLSRVLVTGAVTGGAVAGLGATGRSLWDAAWATWAASGDGYSAAANPLLAVLALPVAVAGRAGLGGDALIHLLLLAAVPLASLGAWFAAGTVTRRTTLRAWAALTWALAPALLLAVGQGRVTAVLVHIVLPWALVALSRAVGADRRDAVLSGLIGAHHATAEEKADLDRFASERIEDLAELADDESDNGRPRERAVALARIVEENDAEFGTVESQPPAERFLDDETHVRAEGRDEGEAVPSSAGSAGTGPSAAGPSEAGSADSPESAAALHDAGGSAASEPDGHAAGSAETERLGRAAPRRGAPEKYGPGSPTAAAVAGLALSVIVAAAPAMAIVVVLSLLVLMVLARPATRRLLLTLAPVIATAAPAWWRAALIASADGATAGLRYILTDTGVPVAAPAPSALDTLLGSPVDIDALVASPALAVTAKALLALLPVLALGGLLVPGRRGNRARAGLLGAVGGLGLALLAARVTVAVGTLPDGTGSVTVPGWAGTGITLATAGLLTAALACADAARSGLVGRPAGWRHGAVAVVTVLALAVPLAVGAQWALRARASTGTGGDAAVMALRPGGQQVPIIAAEIQRSAGAGRVLVLTSAEEGLVVRIWRGAGTQLTDVVPDVLAAQLRSRLASASGPASPSADPTPAGTALPLDLTDPADAELADIVARASAGQDGAVADDLAAHGIAVVLLSDAPGDEATALARSGLESTPGLDQLARTGTGTSWRVGPSGIAESARVTVAADDDGTATLPTAVGAGTDVAVDLPAAGDRRLVLAERADAGWYATLDGEPLEAAALQDGSGTWRQAFSVPSSGGALVVSHGSTAATVVTRLIWAVWVITALAALPLKRRRTTA